MSDSLYLIAGFAVWMVICLGLGAWCILAFLLWFGHYLLVDHWKQQRKKRERAERRAQYAAAKAAREAEASYPDALDWL